MRFITPDFVPAPLAACAVSACSSPIPSGEALPPEARRVQIVEEFRAARAAGRTEYAAHFLAPDARVWFGSREGPGTRWNLSGGRWKDWDEHFRGHTEPVEKWRIAPDRVSAVMHETNDYYRLTERNGGWWLATYFFDDQDRIEGCLVSAAEGRASPEDRREEFEAWAFREHPTEAEYLMPDGSLNPTGDRAPRMRALLNLWRSEVGLPLVCQAWQPAVTTSWAIPRMTPRGFCR